MWKTASTQAGSGGERRPTRRVTTAGRVGASVVSAAGYNAELFDPGEDATPVDSWRSESGCAASVRVVAEPLIRAGFLGGRARVLRRFRR